MGKRVQVFALEGPGLFGGEDVAVGGEFNGGGHVLGEGEFAVMLLGVDEAGDGAGDAAGFVADGDIPGTTLPWASRYMSAAGGSGGLFAVVEEVGLPLWSRMSMKPPPPMFPARDRRRRGRSRRLRLHRRRYRLVSGWLRRRRWRRAGW